MAAKQTDVSVTLCVLKCYVTCNVRKFTL